MASNYDTFLSESGSYEESYDSGRRSQRRNFQRHVARVQKAYKLRKDGKWDELWSKLIQIYSNKYPWSELGSYEDIVVPNMMFSTVNVIVPSIAIHAPKITVNAEQAEHAGAAEVSEAVVNHMWRQYHVQDQVRDAVKDFVIVGHGWLKVTWDSQTRERELSTEEWQEAVRGALMERQQAVAQSTLSENEFPTAQEVVDSVDRTVMETVRDAPKVTRISPFDMVVDPDALRLEDARWIAQRSFVPIEVAKKRDDWDSRVRNKLKASVLSEARDEVDLGDAAQAETKDAAFAVIYEYYDLINGTTCTFAEGGEGFLVKPVKSPFPEVHPFVFIENYSVPERFYPIGDLEQLFGLQLELAIVRTQFQNDRKRGKRINFVRSADLGPEGMDALESGDDNILLEVISERPFKDVFDTMMSQGLHPEWYDQDQKVIDAINMISGVSEYARGQMPEIRRTATEAGLIQDAANARSADKLYRVEQAMAQVARRMITLSQMYMDQPGVARVVSDEMVIDWIPYDREALQGEFLFEVEAGSSQPNNESFRRQSALQLMDALGGMIGSGLLNDQKIIEHVLRHGFGIKDAENYIGPGIMPPPLEGGGESLPPGVDGQQPPMV